VRRLDRGPRPRGRRARRHGGRDGHARGRRAQPAPILAKAGTLGRAGTDAGAATPAAASRTRAPASSRRPSGTRPARS
jgi:hypothetical protein